MKKSARFYTASVAIAQARKLLRSYSPVWLNVEVNREFFQNFTAAMATRGAMHCAPNPFGYANYEPKLLPPAVDSSLRGRPHWRRITQVFQILDEATKEGMVSYTALINCVRQTTGIGCSRKLISKWKLDRGLR